MRCVSFHFTLCILWWTSEDINLRKFKLFFILVNYWSQPIIFFMYQLGGRNWDIIRNDNTSDIIVHENYAENLHSVAISGAEASALSSRMSKTCYVSVCCLALICQFRQEFHLVIMTTKSVNNTVARLLSYDGSSFSWLENIKNTVVLGGLITKSGYWGPLGQVTLLFLNYEMQRLLEFLDSKTYYSNVQHIARHHNAPTFYKPQTDS